MMETLRDRRKCSGILFKNVVGCRTLDTHAFRVLAGLPNNQIASFVEWRVCQRYSRGTISTYQRWTKEFLEFWGNARLFRVSHLVLIRLFPPKADTSESERHRQMCLGTLHMTSSGSRSPHPNSIGFSALTKVYKNKGL
jgi:hypothetical protein